LGVHDDVETPLRSVPEPVEGGRDRPDDRDLSFERFFDSERTRLFGALAVMSCNRAEAEEVMQDAFLKVWERWDRVSNMDSPEGFLYRTALNVYRKRIRRAAVAVRRVTNLLPEDDALGGIETRDEIAQLLRRLSHREREAIVLTAYLGYSTKEAGELLGIKANTVRVLTTRARASLRRQPMEEQL
jgi:RNA polymerase sigma factor (sigma-70 family)